MRPPGSSGHGGHARTGVLRAPHERPERPCPSTRPPRGADRGRPAHWRRARSSAPSSPPGPCRPRPGLDGTPRATPSCSGTRRPAGRRWPRASPPSTTRSRVADVRDDPAGRPRRAQRHRPAVAPVRRRLPGVVARLGRRRRGGRGPRRARRGPRRPAGAVRPGVRRPGRRRRRDGVRRGARRRPATGRGRTPGSVPASGRPGGARPARRRRLRHTAVVPDFPQGTAARAPGASPPTGRSPSPRLGGRHPVRPAQRVPVPFRPGASAHQHGLRPDLAEIADLGGDGVTTPTSRTPAQTETALFWMESSPLAWNRIARTVAASQHLDPWEQARLLGLLDIAMADGYIGSFAQKYDELAWRPVTAIRLADTDGNPATTVDPTWTPLATTPPIPDHDSAHAVQGGAAATVLRRFFGTDRIALRDLQHHAADRWVRHRRPDAAPVRPVLRGRRRELGVPGLHRVPLPLGHRAGAAARRADRLLRRGHAAAAAALNGTT